MALSFLCLLALCFVCIQGFGVVGFHIDPHGSQFVTGLTTEMESVIGFYLSQHRLNVTLKQLQNPVVQTDPSIFVVVDGGRPPLVVVDTWLPKDADNCRLENNQSATFLKTLAAQIPPPIFKLGAVLNQEAAPTFRHLYLPLLDEHFLPKFQARLNLTIPHSSGFTNDIPRVSVLYIFGTKEAWKSRFNIDIDNLLNEVTTILGYKYPGTETVATEISVWFSCDNKGYYTYNFPLKPRM